MEHPKSPWHKSESSPVLELEFQQKILHDIREQLRAFAQESDSTYTIEEEGDRRLVFGASDDELEKIGTRLHSLLDDVNGLLHSQKKEFSVTQEPYNDTLVVKIKT